jgi:hypothetical protein
MTKPIWFEKLGEGTMIVNMGADVTDPYKRSWPAQSMSALALLKIGYTKSYESLVRYSSGWANTSFNTEVVIPLTPLEAPPDVRASRKPESLSQLVWKLT